ncbi:hypothetical protein FIV34_04110 [Luteibacter pinisoli]|uniref:Uncharacterized protein n=1 Tax=Luteibacter pinisoli TaxID=2589080 RepID=A0A4Y5YZW9_9GAMM|nr:hypothetical protein [Luteibacter pinisoli]QDE38441.1 hypothetical protein FIV34_04110 [Luteibacter pinisoli]
MLQSIFGEKSTPDALRAKLAQLESEESGLVTAYQEAALAAVDDTTKQPAADKAHAAMVGHQMNVERARAALNASTRREEAARRELEASTAAVAWTGCIEASKAREPVAAAYAAALKKAGELHAQLRAATAKVFQAVPPGWPTHRTDGFGIDGGYINTLTLSEYELHGLPGGSNPWGLQLSSFAGRFPEFTARIMQARDEALFGASHATEDAA